MGTPIQNEQYTQILGWERAQFERWEQQNYLSRGEPTAVYNCHGMTFASRRTFIYDAAQVVRILADDGYVNIPMPNSLPGDVIVYYSELGDADHSGVVVSEPDPQFGYPRIVSKWGKWKEVIHFANNCPYSVALAKVFRLDAQKQCSGLPTVS